MKKSFILMSTLVAGLAIGFTLGDNGLNRVHAVEEPPVVPQCCYIDPLDCDIEELDLCPAVQGCGNFGEFCGKRPCCTGFSCNATTHKCTPILFVSSSSASSEVAMSSESTSTSSLSAFSEATTSSATSSSMSSL